MDRRSFLRKSGAAAAAAVTLPLGVHKLVEGMPPPTATPIRQDPDPLAAYPPRDPMVRKQIGWKFQDPETKEQYGAVLIADEGVPVEAVADLVAHQMAETMYEVLGRRRTMWLARRMQRRIGA